MRKPRGIFPRSRLLACQPRPCCLGPGAVGCCFLTGCCYILVFLHRAKLPLWRKYQLLGPKEPRKLSSARSHSIRANPRATHLEQLYLATLWMLIEVQAKEKGEKYAISIPAYACKEDLKQAVEDGMLIRKSNFVQTAEMVCLQLL